MIAGPLDGAAWDWVQSRRSAPSRVQEPVREILAAIASCPEDSLRGYTAKFDRVELENPVLTQDQLADLARQCPETLQKAIRDNLDRVEAFHRMQIPETTRLETAPGLVLQRIPRSLDVVACYIPGGRARYPSTAMMTLAPARMAGVPTRILLTPPNPEGSLDPVVAFAALEAGATHVLLAGGAQAVAAAAAGVHGLPPAQAVVGPGNAFVTEAKKQLAHSLRIDSPAGPSELLVLASAGANATFVAWDLMAQAEHDPDAEVVLLAETPGFLEDVQEELARLVPQADRREIIEASLQHARGYTAELDELIAFSNAYGPEHLSLQGDGAETCLDSILAAGSVFIGPMTPVALGDYGSGTNHVLPTMGYARLRGGLQVEDFVRWMSVQQASSEGLAAVAGSITTLAREEGLAAHAASVTARLGDSA